MARRKEQIKDLKELYRLASVLKSDSLFAEVALQHALYFLSIGNNKAAYDEAETAVKYAQSGQDTYLKAMGHLYLGRALMADNKQDLALAHFKETLNFSQQAQMQQVEATSLRSFGEMSEMDGELTAAQSFYRQALDLSQSAGHSLGRAFALLNLGEVAQAKADYQAAEAYFLDALNAFQEIGHRQGEGRSYIQLGINTIYLDDYYRARQYLVRGLTAVRKIGDRHNECLALSHLGFVAMYIRDGETAVFHCQQAINMGREIKAYYPLSLAYFLIGRVHLKLDQMSEAEQAFEQTVAIAEEHNLPALMWMGHAGLAKAAHEREAFSKAKPLAKQILAKWDNSIMTGVNFPQWILSICEAILNETDEA